MEPSFGRGFHFYKEEHTNHSPRSGEYGLQEGELHGDNREHEEEAKHMAKTADRTILDELGNPVSRSRQSNMGSLQ